MVAIESPVTMIMTRLVISTTIPPTNVSTIVIATAISTAIVKVTTTATITTQWSTCLSQAGSYRGKEFY